MTDGTQARIEELQEQLRVQTILTETFRKGVESSYNGWKKAALRLRRELTRVDPKNQLESQLDWRIGDGEIEQADSRPWREFFDANAPAFVRQHEIDTERIAALERELTKACVELSQERAAWELIEAIMLGEDDEDE